MVPFSAKDTVNRKPLPQQTMQPRGHAGPPQQQGAPEQQGNASAQTGQPAAPKQKQ